MVLKQALKLSQVSRLSQTDLYDACKERHINYPSHSLDLEIRALLARAIAGGEGVLCTHCLATKCQSQTIETPVKEPKKDSKTEPQKVGGTEAVEKEANPFEEYSAASSPGKPEVVEEKPSASKQAEPAGNEVSDPATPEAEVQVTPPRLDAKVPFAWTPAEKPTRTNLLSGNRSGKRFDTATDCKVCGKVKRPEWKKDAPPSSHGATCAWCRQRLVFHGRKHLGLKVAGTMEDFSKDQLEAIICESKELRAQWQTKDDQALERSERRAKRLKKK